MHLQHSSAASQNRLKVYILSAFITVAVLFLFLEFWMIQQNSQKHQSNSNPSKASDEKVPQQKQTDFNSLAKILDERGKLLSENEMLKSEIAALKQQNSGGDHHNNNKKEQNRNDNTEHQLPWLIIGIPTVPRKLTPNEPQTPVLLRTLESLESQVSKPSFINQQSTKQPLVKVVVLNQRPSYSYDHDQHHHAFEEAKSKYENQNWIEFHENYDPYNAPPYPEAAKIDAEFANKHQEAPTPRVKRQTLDVASLLKIVEGRSRYFLFYEDDFHFCDNALLHLMNMIERANLYYGENSWSAIRCSFGLAGIVMQNGRLTSLSGTGGGEEKLMISSVNSINSNNDDDRREYREEPHPDVAVLRRYFLRHYARRPPDHLVVEFYAGESSFSKQYYLREQHHRFSSRRRNDRNKKQQRNNKRNVAAYRYNILRHDGVKSTLREDAGWSMPGCFEELVVPQVFEVEAWNPQDCPESDLWPCDFEKNEMKLMSDEERRKGVGFTSFIKKAKIEKREA